MLAHGEDWAIGDSQGPKASPAPCPPQPTPAHPAPQPQRGAFREQAETKQPVQRRRKSDFKTQKSSRQGQPCKPEHRQCSAPGGGCVAASPAPRRFCRAEHLPRTQRPLVPCGSWLWAPQSLPAWAPAPQLRGMFQVDPMEREASKFKL